MDLRFDFEVLHGEGPRSPQARAFPQTFILDTHEELAELLRADPDSHGRVAALRRIISDRQGPPLTPAEAPSIAVRLSQGGSNHCIELPPCY